MKTKTVDVQQQIMVIDLKIYKVSLHKIRF